MIRRIFDPKIIFEKTDGWNYGGFDPTEWVFNPYNVALLTDDKDLNMFQWFKPGVYFGHYFYDSRGKDAVRTALNTRDYFFTHYPVTSIVGFTPVSQKGAMWLTKRIGFSQYGEIDSDKGPEVVSVLTRDEWAQLRKDSNG
jgi:hypothetical protein